MVHWLKKTPAALALVGALALGACDDDDPTGVDDDHNDDVAGVVLTLNGAVLAEYDGPSRAWDATVEIGAGDETAHIDVEFVDEAGNVITPDADTYLQVTVDDETIAEFEQDTPGEFGGHIKGIAEGTALMEFSLMHGTVGAGHADFVTTDLTVQVVVPVV
jgi:hypothetical protein